MALALHILEKERLLVFSVIDLVVDMKAKFLSSTS